MVLTVLACLLVVECRDASPSHIFTSPTLSFYHLSLRLFCVRPSSGNGILRLINLYRHYRSAGSAAEGIPAAGHFCHFIIFVMVVRWNCKVEMHLGNAIGRRAGRHALFYLGIRSSYTNSPSISFSRAQVSDRRWDEFVWTKV
jgi:hypothetical protein